MELAFFGAVTSVAALFVLIGDLGMRKVDKLGRIVIPKELRDKYGLFEGVDIKFEDSGDGIIVKSESACRICNCRIPSDSHIPLCNSCIKLLKEQITDQA